MGSMEYIYYNNTVYHQSGKSYYKFDILNQTKALKIEKEEKRDLVKFIESRNQDIFKSNRLNKIGRLNPALKRIEGIENILNAMEMIIPEKLRGNFYRNLETVKIYFIEYYSEDERNVQGTYRSSDNSILIYTPEYLKGCESDYKTIIITTLVHELYHLSSSKYDKENRIQKSGVEYCNYFQEKDVTEHDEKLESKPINTPLNEGITTFFEQATLALLGEKSIGISYWVNLAITMQLFILIDKTAIEKSYFKGLGTFLIQKDLNKIINDPCKAEYLMYILNDVSIKDYCANNYYPVLKAENILIDYFEATINNLINNHQIEEAFGTYLALIEHYRIIFNDKEFKIAKVINDNFKNIEITNRNKLDSIKKQFANINIPRRTRQ
ncbi:MAG: hypothetical protein IKX00_03465 [Bacilli bacterium]|nr:hypothetical protein [Bacilli bacterium]